MSSETGGEWSGMFLAGSSYHSPVPKEKSSMLFPLVTAVIFEISKGSICGGEAFRRTQKIGFGNIKLSYSCFTIIWSIAQMI